MLKKLDWPFHPILFGLLPVIISWLNVKFHVPITEGVVCLILVEVITLVLFALSSAVLRDIRKGAMVASLGIILVLSYKLLQFALHGWVQSIFSREPENWMDLIAYTIFVGVIFFIVLKEKWKIGRKTIEIDHKRLCVALNTVGIMLFLLNGIPLLEWNIEDQTLKRNCAAAFHRLGDKIVFSNTSNKPDVYWIMLDEYPNTETLMEWGFDNQEFLSFLKSRGFYIVERSISNYDNTKGTVCATLNMQYDDIIRETVHSDLASENIFYYDIQNNLVLTLLRRLGYKYYNICSDGLDFLTPADINYQDQREVLSGLYVGLVIMLTPWASIEEYCPMIRDFYLDLRVFPDKCLKDVIANPQPKFITMHTNIVHAPIIIDEKGIPQPLPVALLNAKGTPERYISQLKWGNRKIEAWVDTILSKPGPKPVIIMHSDHGPDFPKENNHLFVNERLKNFCAIYFPGMKNKGLYPGISPVNYFRAFFNNYFDTKLPILKDTANQSVDYLKGCVWKNVTREMEWGKVRTPPSLSSDAPSPKEETKGSVMPFD